MRGAPRTWAIPTWGLLAFSTTAPPPRLVPGVCMKVLMAPLMVRGERITPGTAPPLATVGPLPSATTLTRRVLAAHMLSEFIITTPLTARVFTDDIDPTVAKAEVQSDG